MTRSIPIAKAWDDALIAYGQNGEPLRPEQGYPVRLFLPGVEGNASVKWLRRIELADQPFMTREETSKYTDPLPDGTARIFSLDMDAKSLITEPSFPDKLTGRDGGRFAASRGAAAARSRASTSVPTAAGPGSRPGSTIRCCRNATRDSACRGEWKGGDATIASRATDETGYVQPTYEVLLAARGPSTAYHFNHIRAWKVNADGTVKFGGSL
jgi:sulfane dehydrogenase subunit SoxC